MTCPRCAACMLRYHALRYESNGESDLSDTSDTRSHITAWHCLACGEYVDAVILENRLRQAVERRTNAAIAA